MSIRGILAIGGVLAALLLVVGCGSDGGDATGSSGGGEIAVETGSLSKAEFVKQASAVCAKGRTQLEKEIVAFLQKKSQNPAKPSEDSPDVEFVEETYIPNYQQQIAEISAIGAPAGDEEQIDAFLQALQDGLDRAAEEPETFTSGEVSLGKAAKLAKAYGLSNCAEI